VKYDSVVRNNEIPSFVAMWMSLEEIMLGEINQTQKDKYQVFSQHVDLMVVE
jgi:hypothetical protein